MKELVTVAVLTYNSGLYVLETLESIYNQAYQNLELIVSDDASTDTTLDVVNLWLSEERNRSRFSKVTVLTVPKNTGVSANCNRCTKASQTDWIKYVAGDDILLPNCITDNMDFAKHNPEAKIIFSQVMIYQDDFNPSHYVRTTPLNFPSHLMGISLTAQDQFQLLLVSDRIHFTPSYFFNRTATQKVGGYDESNRLVEDYPMWLKLTQSGERLWYFHKATVGYRIHSKALNNTGDNVLFKPSVINSYSIRKEFAHQYLPWEMVMSEGHVFYISKLFRQFEMTKNTSFNRFLYTVTTYYLNPFQYIFAIKKRLPSNQNVLFYK
ncbi:glycosyltransferase [Flavobacterium paronense]|uniref:Glycosyltransferase family 2 protein n=1 Tax=Flavobacterium paronense TaxID=1392775 RepID=A0ABV5GBX5_9FLAO|nr:glycosyltransferase [Flavobacterium paronense]MDN3676670.1 glycosyltransferase [Flavobacterium paronense]